MKNRKEYGEFETSLLEKFGEIITERKFCEMISAKLFQRNFFTQEKNSITKEYDIWGEMGNNKLDKIDIKLITALHKNSKTLLVDLSEELNLSIDAIKNRIKNLDKNKILSIYKTKINYGKLGFNHVKLFFYPRKYSTKTESDIIQILGQNKNCVNIIKTIGSWKIEAECLYEKKEELESLLNQLYEKFNEIVFDVEVFPVMNEEILPCEELLLE